MKNLKIIIISIFTIITTLIMINLAFMPVVEAEQNKEPGYVYGTLGEIQSPSTHYEDIYEWTHKKMYETNGFWFYNGGELTGDGLYYSEDFPEMLEVPLDTSKGGINGWSYAWTNNTKQTSIETPSGDNKALQLWCGRQGEQNALLVQNLFGVSKENPRYVELPNSHWELSLRFKVDDGLSRDVTREGTKYRDVYTPVFIINIENINMDDQGNPISKDSLGGFSLKFYRDYDLKDENDQSYHILNMNFYQYFTRLTDDGKYVNTEDSAPIQVGEGYTGLDDGRQGKWYDIVLRFEQDKNFTDSWDFIVYFKHTDEETYTRYAFPFPSMPEATYRMAYMIHYQTGLNYHSFELFDWGKFFAYIFVGLAVATVTVLTLGTAFPALATALTACVGAGLTLTSLSTIGAFVVAGTLLGFGLAITTVMLIHYLRVLIYGNPPPTENLYCYIDRCVEKFGNEPPTVDYSTVNEWNMTYNPYQGKYKRSDPCIGIDTLIFEDQSRDYYSNTTGTWGNITQCEWMFNCESLNELRRTKRNAYNLGGATFEPLNDTVDGKLTWDMGSHFPYGSYTYPNGTPYTGWQPGWVCVDNLAWDNDQGFAISGVYPQPEKTVIPLEGWDISGNIVRWIMIPTFTPRQVSVQMTVEIVYDASETMFRDPEDPLGTVQRGLTSLSYVWDWGDGTTTTGMIARHSWANPGTYNIRMTVSHPDHPEWGSYTATGIAIVTYKYIEPPPPWYQWFLDNAIPLGVMIATLVATPLVYKTAKEKKKENIRKLSLIIPPGIILIALGCMTPPVGNIWYIVLGGAIIGLTLVYIIYQAYQYKSVKL